MKKRELEAVVHKHGSRIAHYAGQIPGSFSEEDVHELRVEYKKLRSFLRLLQLDTDAGHHLVMPEPIKTMYRIAGTVRDRQLFLILLKTELEKQEANFTGLLYHLQKELFHAKESLVEAIEVAHIMKGLEELHKKLPAYLQDATIRKFVHRKVAAIQILLLAVDRDEELHAIRKHLKDLIYVIKIFDNDWGLSFPFAAWRSEKTLNDVAVALGEFNDRCIALSFLTDDAFIALDHDERSFLQGWRKTLLMEKEAGRQVLLEAVQKLRLNHDLMDLKD